MVAMAAPPGKQATAARRAADNIIRRYRRADNSGFRDDTCHNCGAVTAADDRECPRCRVALPIATGQRVTPGSDGTIAYRTPAYDETRGEPQEWYTARSYIRLAGEVPADLFVAVACLLCGASATECVQRHGIKSHVVTAARKWLRAKRAIQDNGYVQ